MKKLLLSTIFAIGFSAAFGQCNFDITTADSSLCAGDSTLLSVLGGTGAGDSLLTTLAAGNNHRGNMFDVVALNAVTITAVDAHPMANTTIEVYYKVGTYVGNEANSGAWTLVGSAAVVAQPQGTLTPVPLAINVSIPAGQTYAFYVTSSDITVSLNYTDGTTAGAVYAQNADIQFLEGAGMEYPFTGGASAFTPRIWNGQIHYTTTPSTLSYAWCSGETTSSIWVAPTATTDYCVTVTDATSGCSDVDSITIVVDPPVSSDFSSVPTGLSVNFTDLSIGATSWFWDFGDGNTSTVPNPTNLYTNDSTYNVMLIATGPCGVDTSYQSITVDNIGIEEIIAQSVNIYPNPNNGDFTVKLDGGNVGVVDLRLIDLIGNKVYNRKLIDISSNNEIKVNNLELSNGVYFVELTSGTHKIRRRIVVKN